LLSPMFAIITVNKIKNRAVICRECLICFMVFSLNGNAVANFIACYWVK
jgi:hypothetical protein